MFPQHAFVILLRGILMSPLRLNEFFFFFQKNMLHHKLPWPFFLKMYIIILDYQRLLMSTTLFAGFNSHWKKVGQCK